jgi:hypothetical protein
LSSNFNLDIFDGGGKVPVRRRVEWMDEPTVKILLSLSLSPSLLLLTPSLALFTA